MGEKLGKPLVEVVGQPRVLPKSLPRPRMVPTEAPVKEKVPLSLFSDAALKGLYVRSYAATERAITRLSLFLGITEQQVVAPIVCIVDTVTSLLKKITPPPGKSPAYLTLGCPCPYTVDVRWWR